MATGEKTYKRIRSGVSLLRRNITAVAQMYYGMHGKTCFARLQHVMKLVIRIVISATILTTKQQKRYSDFAFGYLLFLCF